MKFQVLNTQRKFVLLFSVCGLISMFLPWQKTALLPIDETSNGMHDGNGFIIFICFLICGIFALIGNPRKKLERINTIIISAVSISVIWILGFMYSSAVDILFAPLIFGFYLSGLSALGVIAMMFFYRLIK